MIFDLLRDETDGRNRADVCIVGAGAAGIALALELRRLKKRVVLLEGGGADVEEQAQEPYRSEVVGLEHRGVHSGRFRAKGGTTTRWGGQILELAPEDFEKREWVPESGWPFSKEELKPFYERALELEGLGGVERDDAAVWRLLKLPEPRFADMEAYFSRWCPEPNFARLHGDVLDRDDALLVWLHANCVEMVCDGEQVRAVRCKTQTGKEARFEADEFVFCLGTIECCRFFLQPRPGGLPWNRSGLLGRHFQDHVDSNAAEVRPRDRRRFGELFDNVFLGGYKYHPKIHLRRERQQQEQVLNCAATMLFEGNDDAASAALKETAKHLVRGRWGEVSASDLAGLLRHAPLLAKQTARYGLAHRMYNDPKATVRLRVHCEQRPDSQSSITLGDERDSLGMLRTRLDWRIAAEEIASIRTCTLAASEALSEVAEVIPEATLMEGDGRGYVALCDDSNHHMGGMRMASSAEHGVVDRDLRLHGMRNCFVCSGAVFPTSGFSNPTHTVLALAMRLAARLGRG